MAYNPYRFYEPYPDELYHYGILGMKWGIRKERPQGTGRKKKLTKQQKERIKKIAIGAGITTAAIGTGVVAYKGGKQLKTIGGIKGLKAYKQSRAAGSTMKLNRYGKDVANMNKATMTTGGVNLNLVRNGVYDAAPAPSYSYKAPRHPSKQYRKANTTSTGFSLNLRENGVYDPKQLRRRR